MKTISLRAILAVILVSAMLAGCAGAPAAAGNDPVPEQAIRGCTDPILPDSVLGTAASVFVYENNTGTLLFARQPDASMRPGTMAKLAAAMTMLDCDPDVEKKIPITQTYTENIESYGAMQLRKGEQLKRRDLLCGMLLQNADDAAIALALDAAGSEEALLEKMNEKVKNLGCKDTYFSTVTGKDELSMTTARDMAVIMNTITGSYPTIVEIFGAGWVEIPQTDTNAARYLSPLTGLIYDTTSFGAKLKACFAAYQDAISSGDLVCSAQMNGMDVVCVLFGAQNGEGSDGFYSQGNQDETEAILRYVTRNCSAAGGVLTVQEAAEPAKPVQSIDVPAGGEVHVTNADEFLAAIGPNRTIVLDASIDLTKPEDYGSFTGGEYYTWETLPDGYELRIRGVDNMTIQGQSRSQPLIETLPRYANVLSFESCSRITLAGFTAGHTVDRGTCAGGVLYFWQCSEIDLAGLSLYGCGTVGVSASDCRNLSLSNSEIYECSESGIELWRVSNAYVGGCTFRDIGNDFDYGSVVSLYGSSNVTVENCAFRGNYGENLLKNTSSAGTRLLSCEATGNRWQSAINTEGVAAVVDGCALRENDIHGDYFTGVAPRDRHGAALTGQQLYDMGLEQNITVDKQETIVKAPEAVNGEIHVKTVDELLASIASDTVIVLEGSEFDLSTAADYGMPGNGAYSWEASFDGPELVISGVENLTIRSASGSRAMCTLSAVPRYANVLRFVGCSGITLSGITAGHTIEPGSCSGNVLDMENCSDMTVENCGLFGCGVLGINARVSSGIHVADTEIYECSWGGVNFENVVGADFTGCSFRDLGGSQMMIFQCSDITFDGRLLENGVMDVM